MKKGLTAWSEISLRAIFQCDGIEKKCFSLNICKSNRQECKKEKTAYRC